MSPIPAMQKTQVQFVGQSPVVMALQKEVDRVARSDAKVLITGESGVGKEIVASSLHVQGPRARHVFAPVNCAGLAETLLESELFGHVKGSFTGAHRDTRGMFETAHMGTIFLDEVGEMPLRMQGLLLRVLETGEIQKVGADGSARHVNVRVIAATNRDLRDMATRGTFRQDLFFRLNVIHLVVPPLRERRDDVPLLVTHFLTQLAAHNGASSLTVTPDAMQALMEYSWPGNVRELENLMERLVVTVPGQTIELDHLPADVRGHNRIALRPTRDRRRTVADDLYPRLIDQRESFWATVYPLFMDREIPRATVREVVRRGLEESRGNYKLVVRLFNMESRDYKRFMNFLRKYDCQIPFKDYR